MTTASEFLKWLQVFGVQIGGGGSSLVYLGTWNANTNTPTLVSSVGTANTFYIVSVAGSTNLNGITTWNIGDWAVFNGSVWTRIPHLDSISFTTDNGVAAGGALNLVTGWPGGCGATIKFSGSGSTINLEVIDNAGNMMFGAFTGNTALSSGGSFNSSFGVNTMQLMTVGTNNLNVGHNTFSAFTGGNGNINIGNGGLDFLINGNYNVTLGNACAVNYTGAESSNILIQSDGVLAESNTLRIGRQGTGNNQINRAFIAGITGISPLAGAISIAVDPNGQLCEANSVTFENNLYIADNGDNTPGFGDGSLSRPYLTLTKALAVINGLSPSSSNRFFIHDNRNTDIVEDIQLQPFTEIEGNGNATFHGDISLHSSFASIASDTFTSFGGYREILVGGIITFDFSTFSVANQIIIDLYNVPKAPMTYAIIGNDAANFNADTFRINETKFNTTGRNADGTFWRADVTIASGVTRRIRFCEGWQCSSITKSLGLVPAITYLDVAFCGLATFQVATNTLSIVSSGGASNQPFTFIRCVNCITGNSTLSLDITNDGASNVDITTDISTGYFINSATSLTNITFNNSSNVDQQTSTYVPTNYTRTSYDDDGFTVTTSMFGSQLAGIDAKLSEISGNSYNPGFIYGFQLTWNSVGPPATITVGPGFCRDKDNSFNMALNSPVTLDTTSASIDNGASWSPASWYGYWLYEKSSNLATLMKFSLSFSSPAPIAGYDKVRLVGSIKAQTTGTNILAVIQTGLSNDREYQWNNGDLSLTLLTNGSAIVGAPGTIPCSPAMSPIASKINIKYRFTPGISRGGDTFSISNADFSSLALVSYSGPVTSQLAAGTVGFLPVNSSQNLGYFVDDALDKLTISGVSYAESL